MKIALLIPGTGSRYYCENCTRDGGLSRGLKKSGNDVLVCPMYLPLDADQIDSGGKPQVFFGAVNLYLRHLFPLLNRAPSWATSFLDSKPVLRMAGALSGATNAGGLSELTISMLKGESQKLEQEALLDWLADAQPEILHLSNGLLLGLAHSIRQKLRTPIVCSLQDEDAWINAMDKETAAECWSLMRKQAKNIHLFLPVSDYYAGVMSRKLAISPDRMQVVPVGVDLEGFQAHNLPTAPPVIGFLSHLNESMGLGILIDAFLLLHRRGFNQLRLMFTGGSTAYDVSFLSRVMGKVKNAGLSELVSISPSFQRVDRLRFLSQLSVLSVPVLQGEAFGTFQIEAMAAGVPVVQPALGAFPEVVNATGGGITYSPNTPSALADALASLLDNPDRAEALGRRGQKSVKRMYSLERMIDRIERVYRDCVEGGKAL